MSYSCTYHWNKLSVFIIQCFSKFLSLVHSSFLEAFFLWINRLDYVEWWINWAWVATTWETSSPYRWSQSPTRCKCTNTADELVLIINPGGSTCIVSVVITRPRPPAIPVANCEGRCYRRFDDFTIRAIVVLATSCIILEESGCEIHPIFQFIFLKFPLLYSWITLGAYHYTKRFTELRIRKEVPRGNRVKLDLQNLSIILSFIDNYS